MHLQRYLNEFDFRYNAREDQRLRTPRPRQTLSTMRGQTGILVNVHPVLLKVCCGFDTFSFFQPDRMDNLLRDHS
ncbi:MAG TPA: hypothetical protein DCL54_11160 [Alphaproteobacteria bacterium]|nr:hypothetical protein [Alphaproteobacteria bacterium]HAJ47125.1 hypothetical protein [Alphaproteobacteria bacterium]